MGRTTDGAFGLGDDPKGIRTLDTRLESERRNEDRCAFGCFYEIQSSVIDPVPRKRRVITTQVMIIS